MAAMLLLKIKGIAAMAAPTSYPDGRGRIARPWRTILPASR